MCFDSESNHLGLGTVKGDIMILKMDALAYTSFKQQGYDQLNSLKYSPFYSNYIAGGYENGGVKIFDVNSNQLINEFSNHESICSAISFSPINKLFLCSAGYDGKINFYDIQAKK